MRKLLRRFSDLSIRGQLMIGVVLAQTVLMALLLSDQLGMQKKFLERSHADQARGLAETLAVSSTSWVMANDVVGLQEVIVSVAREPWVTYAMVLAPDGKVLAHNDDVLIGRYADDQVSRGLLTAPRELVVLVDDEHILDVAAPIFDSGRRFGWARIGLSKTGLNANLERNRWSGAIFVLLTIGLGLFFGWRTVRSVTARLDRLLAGFERLRRGERGFRLASAGRNEISQLGHDFNLMLGALERQESDRKRQAEELTMERARLAYIIEGTRVGTWEWSVPTGEVVFNEYWAGMIGYTLEELAPVSIKTWERHVHPDDLVVSGMMVQKHFAGELEAYECEVRMRHKEGHWVWVLDRGMVVRRAPDGTPLLMAGTHLDITEKKKNIDELERHRHHLEELLAERTADLIRANADLTAAKNVAEQANRAKSAFLANMSHEIRTPMNAIVGMVHLMARDGMPPKQHERIDKIDHAVQHLISVVNDILDFSKIEAGKIVLESTPLDLSAVVAEAVAMLGERIRAKGLTLSVEQGVFPSGLRGDPTRLKQAMLNYVSNALKFTEQGGIVVRTRLLAAGEADCLVRFEVEDTGIGIAPEVLPSLFQAFAQADNSTTRQYGGSGLGLSITRRLVELMGGEAGVDSLPGQGSRFWFTARLARVDDAAAETLPSPADAPVSADAWSGIRVLLVEDEEINREIATELLQELGVVVDVAEDGLQAVERCSEHAYPLILMDMQMPRMDGLEATRRIRAMAGGQAATIIAMTANAYAEDKQRCFEAGMNAFVAKPVDAEAFLAMVDDVLRGHRSG